MDIRDFFSRSNNSGGAVVKLDPPSHIGEGGAETDDLEPMVGGKEVAMLDGTTMVDLGTAEVVALANRLLGEGETVRGKLSPTVTWLRSLSNEEASAIDTLMRTGLKLTLLSQVSEPDRDLLASLKSGRSTEGRDGAWYTDWATCEVVTAAIGKKDHPRWQVRLTEGPNSVGAKLRKVVSSEAWETLLKLNTYPKFGYHHIAYNASPAREIAPLPLDVGSGSSISHPCDQNGCLRHLETTVVHKANMDRQRCTGIVLLHFRGCIIQEIPCGHGEEQGINILGEGEVYLETKIMRTCRKVRLIEIPEAGFLQMFNLYACDDYDV